MNSTLLFKKHMQRINHIHFIGIGGSGMNGIAEVMLNLGYQISGSDQKPSAVTRRLERLGAKVMIGHSAKNIALADVIVKSSAIKDDNIEIQTAISTRTPIISRAEMLAEIMRYRFGIAVSGTHGKTTTTSILSSILGDAGLDPTFIIGGILNRAGTSAKLGQSDYLVAEADESDASFLHLTPSMITLSNIDADHLETYGGSFETLKETFIQFMHQMPFYGLAVVCADDPVIRELIPKISRTLITYGTTKDCDLYAKDLVAKGLSMHFNLIFKEKSYPMQLNMPGRHNVLNSLACIAVALELGVDMNTISQSISDFGGVDRRFTPKGTLSLKDTEVPVFEDYGHHPKEISAVLQAAKDAFPERNILGIFQPHRFSRTLDLFDSFSDVLSNFDKLILTDVYAAGESHIPHADGKALAQSIRARAKVEPVFIKDLNTIPDEIINIAKENDIILVMGAGSIGEISNKLVQRGKNNAND